MLARVASWLARVVVVAVLCWAGAAVAQEQYGGLGDPANWYYAPLYLRQEDRLPAGIAATEVLSAAYNYAYDATVLGVNFKVINAIEYYGALCLVDTDGNLDVLEVLGPFPTVVQWSAGPYHLAAGTAEGNVHCWLTAPREYPHEVVLTNDYEPGTAFSVKVYPPDDAVPDWPQWLATIACQSHFDPEIRVSHVGGDGRNRGGLSSLPMTGKTEALQLEFWPTDDGLLPYMLVGGKWARGSSTVRGTQHSVSIYHHDEARDGWVRDGMLQRQAFPQGFSLGATGLVAYKDYQGALEQPGQVYVELINHLDSGPHRLRPGTRVLLGMSPAPELFAFLDSTLAKLPFVLISNQTDISFGRLAEQPGLPDPLAHEELLVHTGEVGYLDGEPYPLYPVVALAATARWDTGYPEVYWVQDGSNDQAGGLLYRLRYAQD